MQYSLRPEVPLRLANDLEGGAGARRPRHRCWSAFDLRSQWMSRSPQLDSVPVWKSSVQLVEWAARIHEGWSASKLSVEVADEFGLCTLGPVELNTRGLEVCVRNKRRAGRAVWWGTLGSRRRVQDSPMLKMPVLSSFLLLRKRDRDGRRKSGGATRKRPAHRKCQFSRIRWRGGGWRFEMSLARESLGMSLSRTSGYTKNAKIEAACVPRIDLEPCWITGT